MGGLPLPGLVEGDGAALQPIQQDCIRRLRQGQQTAWPVAIPILELRGGIALLVTALLRHPEQHGVNILLRVRRCLGLVLPLAVELDKLARAFLDLRLPLGHETALRALPDAGWLQE